MAATFKQVSAQVKYPDGSYECFAGLMPGEGTKSKYRGVLQLRTICAPHLRTLVLIKPQFLAEISLFSAFLTIFAENTRKHCKIKFLKFLLRSS
jgi:hypothetical protein